MQRSTRFSQGWQIGAAVLAVVLVAAACTSNAPAPGGSGAAAGGTKHVSILNKDMTDAEIKAEITKEAGLVVGNWTYSANATLIDEFQKYVKATYGEVFGARGFRVARELSWCGFPTRIYAL